jgi:hypothetical protein
MTSRRTFLGALLSSGGAIAADRLLTKTRAQINTSIHRHALVRRHNPHLNKLDPLSPLSLGNGSFAFTADITGLQTLDREYKDAMPLCTMSQWGWHTTPRPKDLVGVDLKLADYDTHGRKVGYHTSSEGQTELFNWLRENPHRLHLGRIRLCKLDSPPSAEIDASEISDIDQQLDLWRGVLTSKFKLDGQAVEVTTTVHPTLDLIAVSIESGLISTARLGVGLSFPYGSPAMQAADWKQPEKHRSEVVMRSPQRAEIQRFIDYESSLASVGLEDGALLNQAADHDFVIQGRSFQNHLRFTVHFSPDRIQSPTPNVRTTLAASARHWQRFWSTGGAVELADSKDERAPELERRVVLSQYLTAIQCSGNLPPQETGLTVNSWYGKFHLEMHWWHAAHFALWNRLPLFERSLGWYQKILPQARALAQSQGYTGARWPKMVGPEGRDSPSPIGPLLIWQQPHPIFYAELCYLTKPNAATLKRYADIVFESASFMASYAFLDKKTVRFVLGPPVIPAQENHPPRETWNPTFELAYWKFGLEVAQRWRQRLEMSRLVEWERIIKNLAPLPTRDGVYLAHENCPQTYTERNRDHPSMLGALGILPGAGVDHKTMRQTLKKTMKEWRWEDTWGWDYPMTAMTAARLGETEIAIDALLMKTEKNRYLANGHNWQRANLPCYLPGNGGLLYAIALMCGGWKDAPEIDAPGFPNDGSWFVRFEGLNDKLLHEI